MERNYVIATVVILIAAGSLAAWFFLFSGQPEDLDLSPDGLTLTSPAFEDGGAIPEKYTFDGQDVSPPLEVSGADGNFLAVIMDDPDASGFVHWLIWNVPADIQSIPEGVPQEETVQELGGAAQGQNGFGDIGYRGPKPPEGETHEYRIRVYVLNTELNLEPGASMSELIKAMRGHAVQMAELVGTYER